MAKRVEVWTDRIEKLFDIDEQSAGMRLDRFLHERIPGISRHELIEWIQAGKVTHNKKMARKGVIVKAGDRISLMLPCPVDTPFVVPDHDMPLEILFEDQHLVAVNKPPGIPTHPLRTGETGTVANALVHRYPEMQTVGFSTREPGLVHRLDRDTSGVLLAARQQSSFEALRLQFQQREIVKVYTALVHGHPDEEGEIDLPIGAGGRRNDKVVVVVEPRKRIRGLFQASTRYRCVRYFKGCSLIHVWISSATRHQIRAHMAFLGHPVLGDTLYGGADEIERKGMQVPRQMLHAAEIRFHHPVSGELMEIRCPLPQDFQSVLDRVSSGEE